MHQSSCFDDPPPQSPRLIEPPAANTSNRERGESNDIADVLAEAHAQHPSSIKLYQTEIEVQVVQLNLGVRKSWLFKLRQSAFRARVYAPDKIGKQIFIGRT